MTNGVWEKQANKNRLLAQSCCSTKSTTERVKQSTTQIQQIVPKITYFQTSVHFTSYHGTEVYRAIGWDSSPYFESVVPSTLPKCTVPERLCGLDVGITGDLDLRTYDACAASGSKLRPQCSTVMRPWSPSSVCLAYGVSTCTCVSADGHTVGKAGNSRMLALNV